MYTAARAEKQVEIRLQQMGIACYLPLLTTKRKWSDRYKLVDVPLFSSYIFVYTTDAILRTLNSVNGVSHIVYYLGQPAIVKCTEINSIKRFLIEANEGELLYNIEDELLIGCGPLKNISGKVKKISKTHIILYLDQIGTTVCVKKDQVLKKK
ncbi:MAG: transcription termination/antitermination NusG family protein [Paludibacter sp.]|nr:transcription termination/antitermination NusG family protein [Paludibacter sp.]